MDCDVPLRSGRIRVRTWGDPAAPLLLCVPGLAANLSAYTCIAETLAGPHRRVVAMDLRGTGRSEVTAAGSYGWQTHADDVLAVAEALGAQRFDLAGWSLGALIAMQVAACGGGRLRSITLIDHAGPTDPAALAPIRDGLTRLDLTVRNPRDYLDFVRAAGHLQPWSAFWDDYYTYELTQLPDGQWRPSATRAAAEEELRQRWPKDWSPFWSALTMPATVVRAVPPRGGALVVPQSTVDALAEVNPAVRLVQSPGDHFTCMLDQVTVAAVASGISLGQN